MNEQRHVIIQVWKSDSVFRSHRLSDNNLIDVIELVPIFVALVVILDERLEFWASRNRHIQCFRGEETFRIKQVKEVIVDEISQQLIRKTIKCRHLRQGQVPLAEC